MQRKFARDLIFEKFDLPAHMRVVLATPPLKVLTEDARKLEPARVSIQQTVMTTGYGGLCLAGVAKGDLKLMGQGIVDPIMEPLRAKLIPNFDRVKKAAMRAGAHGCSISGSGPTVFALCDDTMDLRAVGRAMGEAFELREGSVAVRVAHPNNVGATVLARKFVF